MGEAQVGPSRAGLCCLWFFFFQLLTFGKGLSILLMFGILIFSVR